MSIPKTLVVMMLAGLQLTACASHSSSAQRLDMRNPATVWCVHRGGKPYQVDSAAGITGYCTLPSGEHIDQWTLYHRDRQR